MKLLTKEIQKRLPALYSQEHTPDPIVQVKFFVPWGNWTWYATEYDPEKRLFFGYVVGHENELGYFSLADLESIKGPFGLGIERDSGFSPAPLSEIKAKHEKVSPMAVVKPPTPVPPAPAPAEEPKSFSTVDAKNALAPILATVKDTVFVAGYKATDSEALGMLISKYFEWNGLEILKTAYSALEDSNYHRVNKTIQTLIDDEEKIEKQA